MEGLSSADEDRRTSWGRGEDHGQRWMLRRSGGVPTRKPRRVSSIDERLDASHRDPRRTQRGTSGSAIGLHPTEAQRRSGRRSVLVVRRRSAETKDGTLALYRSCRRNTRRGISKPKSGLGPTSEIRAIHETKTDRGQRGDTGPTLVRLKKRPERRIKTEERFRSNLGRVWSNQLGSAADHCWCQGSTSEVSAKHRVGLM